VAEGNGKKKALQLLDCSSKGRSSLMNLFWLNRIRKTNLLEAGGSVLSITT
jgi:hypothetical protein